MEKQFLFAFFLILISAAFSQDDPKICRSIRTRILNEGDRFEPRQCFFCECRNSSLHCNDESPDACPEPPCEPQVQISTPDRCCKICPGVGSRCRFNGMSVEDGESFNTTPSGSCECHNGKLACLTDQLPAAARLEINKNMK